jgi:hypothetical protein
MAVLDAKRQDPSVALPPAPVSLDSPAEALSVSFTSLEDDIRRSVYQRNPALWARKKLKAHLWSLQTKIIESVRDNRRTAVKSCHSAGKSHVAAILAAWWIESHKPGEAFVITSAPTAPQVRAILWRYINRLHASGGLSGRLNQTEWWAKMPEGHEEMVAFGRKPADMDVAAFQGIHAKYVLVIFDEGAGIHKDLFDQADSLISNEFSRMIVIGNPDDPQSHFATVCKPGSGWNVIKISAFDTPNFTGEPIPDYLRHVLVSPVWVEEKKKSWGETNPLYIAKILGEFPELSTDGLIPISWIKAAQERTIQPSLPIELGVDVGGGRDKSVIAVRKGGWVRILKHRKTQTPNTMTTLGNVILALREEDASKVKIDDIGIGRGVKDRAEEMASDQSSSDDERREASLIEGVNVGRSAVDTKQFVNLRAEGYWKLRQMFESGQTDIDPDDDDLAAQLVDLKWKAIGGRIQIESKEEIRKRGKNSPDDADAVMLVFIDPPEKEKVHTLGW